MSESMLQEVVKKGQSLDWGNEHDMLTAVAVNPYRPGWYSLDDLSQGCWVAYFHPGGASRVEIHRGSMLNCAAACELDAVKKDWGRAWWNQMRRSHLSSSAGE